MMRYFKYCLFFFVLTGVSSCYRNMAYRSPNIEVDGLFREGYTADTTTMADMPWGEFFTDPYLLTLISEGLQENFDLRIAYARIRVAEANLQMARAAFFPTVGVAAQVNETLMSNGNTGKHVLGYSTPEYSLGITSSWEADIWGKLSAQKRSQYALYLNSWEYRNLIQTSLISNIAQYYYTLLALDEQLEITRRTADLLLRTAETMEELMHAGLQNGAAVQQSYALYYATVVTIPDLETQIRQTENALSVLLARDPGPIDRSVLAAMDSTTVLQYGVPAQMLARRPDVRQAELALRSAFELSNAARAAFFPTISLGSGSMVGYASNTLSNFFRPENLLAVIVGQLTQPIFARGQLKGNLKIARARQEEALLTFSKTALTAGEEVSDLIYAYRSSLEKNPVRDKQIAALETAVYFTQELLVAGEANYTEVLNAQQNLLSALLGQTSDRLEQLQYRVRIYVALGGGLDPENRYE